MVKTDYQLQQALSYLKAWNIFNGAVDNASGAAGLLTLAQSFIRTKPVADRSIVFLAVTSAEAGLLGSEYYVENPIFPLRDTAAVLNLDTPHFGGPTRNVTVFAAGNTDLEEYARAVALLQGREITPDPMPERGFYFQSDSFTFAKVGVPGHGPVVDHPPRHVGHDTPLGVAVPGVHAVVGPDHLCVGVVHPLVVVVVDLAFAFGDVDALFDH